MVNLILSGKNKRRQLILRRHIERLEYKLSNLKAAINLKTTTMVTAAALLAFAPQLTKAQQSFDSQFFVNPFGLTSSSNNYQVSHPQFIDLDNDGDLDIVSGNSSFNLSYFENISSGENIAFAAVDNILFPVIRDGNPAFADLDNDGDQDLITTSKYGGVFYYENISFEDSIRFKSPISNAFGLSYINTATFADLDNDGDFDMISDDNNGFKYYENTTSGGVISFAAPVQNPFGLSFEGYLRNSTPELVDFDSDGDFDLFSGDSYGQFYYYENISTDDTPSFAPVEFYPFGLYSAGRKSSPTFGDIDNDGDLDLLTGSENNGGFSYDFYFSRNLTPIASSSTPLANLCGTTLVGNEVVSVNTLTGASKYSFSFKNEAGLVVSKENRTSAFLNIKSVDYPSLTPGETYTTEVRAIGDNIDSVLISECSLTINEPIKTQLSSDDCGKVMTSAESIDANEVVGVEKYRFTFRATGFATIEKTQSSSSYSFLTYQSYFAPGTEYDVTVQTSVNGIMNTPGSVCTITTPGANKGNVLDCEKVYTSWSGIVKAEVQSGAQQYRFAFIDELANQQFIYASNRPYVKLNKVSGLNPTTEYSVKMSVRKNNVYGLTNDLPCTITTPSGAPAREGDAFVNGFEEIFLYPNPAQGSLVYFSSTIHNVQLINMVGDIMIELEQADNLNISKLNKGMYIIKANEGIVKFLVE